MKLRVMSSNVWGNCPSDRPIADRDDKMAAIYHRYLPDVIGMQECSPVLRRESPNLFDLVSDVYDEVPSVAINERNNNFTPILYQRDRLTLEDHGWLCFEGLNDHGSKSLAWALFCLRESGERFIHINTHYFWTQDEAGREARVSNSRQLLALCRQVIDRYPYPVVMTGDFNCCTEESPIVAILENGFRETRLCAEQPVLPLRSYHAYPDIDDTDPEHIHYPNGHMPDAEMDRSIDHIFVNAGLRVLLYQTVVDGEALQASDHCPLYVDLENN